MAISKDKKRMQISISKKLVKQLEKEAKESGKTKSEIIENVLIALNGGSKSNGKPK